MKEIHELTPKEIHEEARGEMLLAIGRGDFSSALYGVIDRAVRSGYERGKRNGAGEVPPSYVPQDIALACIKALEGAGYGRPGHPNTLIAMVRRAAEDVVRLGKEVEMWKGRAERHGCDVVNGDPDCG